MKKYRVEFGELRIGETAKRNLLHCVDTNWASSGPKVLEFEKSWSGLFDYGFSKAMSSGTDACINACASLYDFGAKRGDEIIVPALSFIATSNSVLHAGFTPVFVDVEKHTLNINPTLIEDKITPKTRAIMCVHTMGKPCNMPEIMRIANKHGLHVIEDSAESHGARTHGKYIGHWGHMATFSFYIAHLICCGEGGMVSTNHSEIAEVLHSTRTHGRKNGDLFFDHVRLGYNSKMNDLEASLGLEGIEQFWNVFNVRKHNLYYLLRHTKDLEDQAWFNLEESYEDVCPHAFTITLKNPKCDAKSLYEFLENKSIKCKRNFGCIPTQHKAFDFMGFKLGQFPESEYVGNHGLHFGIHQYLTHNDLDYISESLHEWFNKNI